MEILIIRFSLAYISLWLFEPKKFSVNSIKTELLFMGAGFCGITFYQFLENIALSYTHAANVSIIVSINPMITAIIAQIVLKEKHLTPFFIFGFILAIFGITLISINGTEILHLNPKGDFFAFGAAVSWGFYSLFVSKINKLDLDPVLCTRRSFLWALLFMIPIALISTKFGTKLNFSAGLITLDATANSIRFTNFYNWFNLIFLGVGASAYCFVIWNIVCKYFGTVKTTIAIYMSPVVTILFGFIFLKEPITFIGSIGAILTICGLLLSKKNQTT